MAKSLKDQLLQAGLVSQKKAQKASKSSKKNRTLSREVKAAAEEKRQQQLEADKARNAALKAEADNKAIQAQIRQLIDTNKIDRQQGEIAYNFTHGTTVKKLYVNETQQKQLIKGLLGIVCLNEVYELVPHPVAEKIAERDPELVIELSVVDIVEEDDPYADYQIPDDLMW